MSAIEEHNEHDRGNPLTAVLESTDAIREFYRLQELEGGDVLMDETDVERKAYREGALQLKIIIDRTCGWMATFRSLPLDCFIVMSGNGFMINCKSQKDIIRRHKLHPKAKANVSNWCRKIHDEIGFPLQAGQREHTSKMVASRNGQLAK